MRTPDDIHDEWLVIRCQDGDQSALPELVERWQPRLFQQAMRLTGKADAASDVVQEAWVAIVRGVNRLDDPSCFRGWAYRIVTNKCADWVRRQQLRRARTTSMTDEPVDRNSIAVDQSDDITILREALKQLSHEQRAILSMFYLDGMSTREIARAFSMPAGTVKSRMHYARAELKQVLERKET